MLSPIAKAIETRTTKGASAATEAALPMTEAGIVLGTAAYMGPEQARGQPVTTYVRRDS